MHGRAVVVLSIASATEVLCGSACSRASEADCRLIVDRSVELEMKESSDGGVDAAAVAAREQQVRAELDDQIRACQGRRVTEKTMACVRAANSSKELEECLR